MTKCQHDGLQITHGDKDYCANCFMAGVILNKKMYDEVNEHIKQEINKLGETK